jgi:type I restriction enzyme R subunit
MRVALSDEDAVIDPSPTEGGGRKAEPELDRLRNILKTFNERWGAQFSDADRIRKVIAEELPNQAGADRAYRNAQRNNDRTAARLEHDRALQRAMVNLIADHTELFKLFSDDPGFQRWLSDTMFEATCMR